MCYRILNQSCLYAHGSISFNYFQVRQKNNKLRVFECFNGYILCFTQIYMQLDENLLQFVLMFVKYTVATDIMSIVWKILQIIQSFHSSALERRERTRKLAGPSHKILFQHVCNWCNIEFNITVFTELYRNSGLNSSCADVQLRILWSYRKGNVLSYC